MKQQGFSIALILFILVVMSSLGLALMKTSSMQQSSTAMEVLSNRAFYAAESGAQLFASHLFPLNAAGVETCSTPVYTFNNVNGLSQCTATIASCDVSSAQLDGSTTSTFMKFVSEGRCGSGQQQTVRRVQVMVRHL